MIYGCRFRILIRKEDDVFIAVCPGVGGVYEEGNTEEEAVKNAYESACVILDARFRNNDLMRSDNQFLELFRKPPRSCEIAKNAQETENDFFITTFPCSHDRNQAITAKNVVTAS